MPNDDLDDLNDVLQAVSAGPDVMEYCLTADTPPCEYCLHVYDPPRLTPSVRLTPPTQTLDGRLTQAPTCEACWQMLLEWAREDAELV